VTQRFPSSEYDVLVVVEGKTLLRSGPLEQLRNLVTDLQLVDGTRGAISLFSAREPPEGSHLPAPLFPDELPQGTEYDHLIGRMKAKELPAGTSLYASQTLDVIAEVHKIMENQAGIGNVWSLETLRRWLSDKADIHDASVLKEYVTALPGFLVRRFIAEHQDAVVVSSRIPDSDANQLLPVIEGLDKRLNELRASHPGYTIAVTGLAAVAARSRSTNSAPG
jgi:hypothetical protein